MKNNQVKTSENFAKIKVLGIGGSGCNTITRLSALKFPAIEYIAVNTDYHSLISCSANKVIKLGSSTTSGLGTGGDPQLGRIATEENYRELISAIKDADLLFLTAGLGGGTGSGGIEIIARMASSLDIPTISVVTLPFSFESDCRKSIAYETTISLQPFTNTIITIPNDRIIKISGANATLRSALGMADDILINALSGLSELMKQDGLLTVDFSHIKKLLGKSGGTFISMGYGQGKDRIVLAIKDTLSHPLLEPVPLHQAKGIIIKIIGNMDVKEINQSLQFLKDKTMEDTEIIPVIDQADLGDLQVKVAIILTGMGAASLPKSSSAIPKAVTIKDNTVILNNEKENIVFTKAVENYGDELEVPAFIRRGYNLNKKM